MWRDLSNADISYWIQKEQFDVQNSEGPFEKSKRVLKNQERYCTKGIFHVTMVNGGILVIGLYILNLLVVFIASSVNSCQRPNQRFLIIDLATGEI